METDPTKFDEVQLVALETVQGYHRHNNLSYQACRGLLASLGIDFVPEKDYREIMKYE